MTAWLFWPVFWLLLAALVACCVVLGWGTAVWLARPGEQRRREHLARLDARNAALEAKIAVHERVLFVPASEGETDG